MTETTRRRWPHTVWDPEAFEVYCRAAGTSPEEVERECRLKSGRFEDLAENGWSPLVWELSRIAEVLGTTMDDLHRVAFAESR